MRMSSAPLGHQSGKAGPVQWSQAVKIPTVRSHTLAQLRGLPAVTCSRLEALACKASSTEKPPPCLKAAARGSQQSGPASCGGDARLSRQAEGTAPRASGVAGQPEVLQVHSGPAQPDASTPPLVRATCTQRVRVVTGKAWERRLRANQVAAAGLQCAGSEATLQTCKQGSHVSLNPAAWT